MTPVYAAVAKRQSIVVESVLNTINRNKMKFVINPHREPSPRGSGFTFFIAMVAFYIAVTFFCLFLCSGCASSKRMERYSGRDSTIYHHIYDTTRIVVAVTRSETKHSSTETKSGKQIFFAEGGGTYNDQTGEATNVSSVISDTHTASETDSTALYRAELDAVQARCDSLSEVCKTYASQLETERTVPKRTGYDRFCSWWFWITAILLLIKVAAWIMEKFPTTAPYIILIRRFVPFL